MAACPTPVLVLRVREVVHNRLTTVGLTAPIRQAVILNVTVQTQKLLRISTISLYVEKLLHIVETVNASRRLLLHPELVVIGQQ